MNSEKKLTEQEKIEFNNKIYDSNEIIGTKREAELVLLYYWKNPLICRTVGCQEMTHLTRSFDLQALHKIMGLPDDGMRMYVPICEKHYHEAHAFYLAHCARIEKESKERINRNEQK
jgi:hypothetical protein